MSIFKKLTIIIISILFCIPAFANTPPAYDPPVCSLIDISAASMSPDNAIEITQWAYEPHGLPVKVSYLGLPPGATVTPAAGTVVTPTTKSAYGYSYENIVEIKVKWTPTQSQTGLYDISTIFTQNAGFQYGVECAYRLKIDGPPQVVDRCGVCGGDGTSCLGCTNKTVEADIAILDNGTNAILEYAHVIGRQLKRYNSLTKKDSRTIDTVEKLHTAAWTAINKVPAVQTLCTNTEFCSSISFASEVATYSVSNDEMTKLTIQLADKYKQVLKSKNKKTKPATTIKNEVISLSKANSVEAAKLPTETHQCS